MYIKEAEVQSSEVKKTKTKQKKLQNLSVNAYSLHWIVHQN